MARKSKRKIVVNERNFQWYVAEELDGVAYLEADTILTILSDDKRFIIKYPFSQSGNNNFLVVIGKEFGGNGSFGKSWQRVISPVWEKGKSMTPGIVREIIEWSLSEKTCFFVDFLGNEIKDDVN